MSRPKKDRCLVCGHDGSYQPLDHEHVLTAKARPDLVEDERNIMVLCRRCHILKGTKGVSFMADNFPQYKNWLIAKGFTFVEHEKKWRLYVDTP